jgi:hypothetical protein
VHRLSIHSRVNDAATGEQVAFDTRFVFDDSSGDIEVLE